MSNIPSSLSPSRVSVQWHDVSVSSFSPGKAHSIVCHQCFTCDMILLNLFSWLCWVIVVARKIVLETSQLSPWHAVSGVWELQCLQLCRFSYSVAYGMLVSQSAIEPSSPTLQGGCLTTEPPGKALWHALSACFYTLYQRHIVWWDYITIQGCKAFGMLQELLHPHWSNTTRCLSPCSTIPCNVLPHWLLVEHFQ